MVRASFFPNSADQGTSLSFRILCCFSECLSCSCSN